MIIVYWVFLALVQSSGLTSFQFHQKSECEEVLHHMARSYDVIATSDCVEVQVIRP